MMTQRMYRKTMNFRSLLFISMILSAVAVSGLAAAAEKPPAVGDVAKDFELNSLGGDSVKLSKLTEGGPVVLVMLRGYPGYQCPICTRQFGDFVSKADEFKKAGAKVVFVYPGAAEKLKEHAAEFVKGKDYPDHFNFLLDPDFTFTNSYGLRWNAKNETAYPSTFVVVADRKITFAKVSKTHGDRSEVPELLKALEAK